MADERTIEWEGKSGRTYKYWIHDLDTTFVRKPGNYIFAKETEPKRHKPIYIGETSDLHERLNSGSHHADTCIKRQGATHIHAHTNSLSDQERRDEEADIRAKWDPPCNQQ